jgi:hypothetical protein
MSTFEDAIHTASNADGGAVFLTCPYSSLTWVLITFLLLVTQTFPYSEWEANGGGFSANLVTRLLKNLPTPRGSAVVLNAKGGREVSVLRKADMKVVACYSAGKESYPGKLTATVPTEPEEQEEEIEGTRLAVERTGLGGHGGASSSGTAGGTGEEDREKEGGRGEQAWLETVLKDNPEEGKNKNKKM